jgi:hypothetical protein
VIEASVISARLVSLALALVVACAGCGAGGGRNNLPGSLVEDLDEKRSELERYKRFQLYYLGKTFEGFALSRVGYNRDPWRTVGFIYGDCEPPGGADGGCAPPLEVQVDPACARNRLKDPKPVERLRIRGVPAASDQDGTLSLYTGWETITIFGSGKAQTRRAARALRTLSSEGVTPKLPPPAPDVHEQRISCAEQGARHPE